MKKLFLFIATLFYLLGTSGSYAQNTFAPIGAEWWYYSKDEFWQEGVYSLLHAKVTHDTLYEGKTCQVIEQEGIKKTGFAILEGGKMQISAPVTEPFRSLYVYDNQDTVFIYNDLFGKFTPLYVYNVTEGQTLCLPVIPDVYEKVNFYTGSVFTDSVFCMVVDSIRTVQYDTSLLKTIYTHSLYDANGGPGERTAMNWSFADYRATGIYAQTIGGFHAGILPKPQYMRGIFDGVEPTARMQLNCYHDDSRGIKISDSSCNYLPSTIVSVNELSMLASGISFYPNPTSGVFSLTAQKPLPETLNIQVTDLSGRKMTSLSIPAGQTMLKADLGNLSSGIYLLQLQAGEQSYYQKLVIRH